MTFLRAKQWVSAALATIVIAGSLTSCTSTPEGPEAVASSFLSALADGDTEAAAALADRPEAAKLALDAVWQGLQAQSLESSVNSSRYSHGTGTVDVVYQWHLPKDRVWKYTNQIQVVQSEDSWKIRWTATDIHPKLGDQQRMELRADPAKRASVNEHAGSDVLVPGRVIRVKFNAAQAKGVAQTADSLALVLKRFDESLTGRSIAESATAVQGDYQVMTLSSDDFDSVRAPLVGLSGVSFTEEADLLPTDPTFAPDIVGQVKKAVIQQVDGASGWRVVTVNHNGVDVDVLTETAAQPAASVSISLDRPVQVAAQNAVNARREQSMMVVLKPSTGEVLAVAQNPAADKFGPVASTGLYPPGSTFKIITAGAAISSDLAQPETLVGCPGRIEIGERTIPNYNDFSVGTVPMSTAFARSCNTSFAWLASKMQSDALTVSASQCGIGPDYTVDGLPTESGSVPVAADMIQRTEDGIGQGKVLVSPFGMAVAAATVAQGVSPVPYLIKGTQTQVSGEHPAISRTMVAGLRTMMREVVTSGTAARITDQGEVFGKTGEAEVEGGSHAWFVGYRGDIAFATLVVLGGSSDNAVAVTRDFFAALPSDY